MKAALKFIMTLAGLLLIGLNIGVMLLVTQFEGVLRGGLTHQAGKILGAEVRLEAVRLDWAEQALVFKGVTIFNPEGFTDRDALRVASLVVRPDPMSIFARTPAVRQVSLEGAEVHLQYKADNGSNLGAMLDHARAWTESQADGEKRVWGRHVNVRELRSDPVKLQVERIEPAAAPVSRTLEAFTIADPGGDEAVSGARVIHLVLKGLMKQLTAAQGLSAPVRELLLGEWDREAA